MSEKNDKIAKKFKMSEKKVDKIFLAQTLSVSRNIMCRSDPFINLIRHEIFFNI